MSAVLPAEIARQLGFTVREASFDTGTIILERGDESFKFSGIGAVKEALRLAESAVAYARTYPP